MSMITSCPACGTMFRVVADQLKISEGWVRCGHCAEVFDASAHLGDESIFGLAEPEPLAVPPPMAMAPTLTRRAPDPVPPPSELPTRQAELPTRSAELPGPDPSIDSSSFFGVESESLEPSPLDAPFVFRRSDLALPDHDSSILPPEPSLPMGDDEEDLDDVSFVRKARRRSLAHRPAARITLAVASLGLACVLLLQVAYHDRDRLALAQPALQPALARMCAFLDCVLGPPRQIEAIVIESSGFNRLRNNTYRLAFTLRNTAPVQVAAPAMELTVTDGRDQPIARRVLMPAELGAAGGAIAAGSEWSRVLGIALDMPPDTRVAGYRLLAFHP